MPSVLQGFEYDVFVSYRQNDNRSGWVTEFVKNLQEELSATLKEPVNLYFDTNPHDGLLETHHVDKSLEGKLKCLIFIPIVSQTYCDQRSFAWQHEFLPFNKLSSADRLGRDIRLKSGNVASRILPIKIHELEEEDRSTIEQEIGGALRAIDFIYDSAGVNRPLLPSDSPEKNLNHALYRDQINKAARSIKDLVQAMKQPAGEQKEADIRMPSPRITKSRTRTISWIAIALLAIGAVSFSGFYFLGWGQKLNPSNERSIAVLPFKLIGNDQEGKYFAEGVADALINHLHGIPNLKVRSRTSVEKYAGALTTVPEIGKELDVLYVVEGSTQKYKDNVRIIVQLINTQTDEHVWFKEYNEKFDDIFRIQSEIALNITAELNVRLTGAEKARVQKIPTKNVEAWDLYLRGTEYRRSFWKYFEPRDRAIASEFFRKAIKKDPQFAHAYLSLADVASQIISPDSVLLLINKSIELDPGLPHNYESLGRY
jgi:TolB-like protein